ncbi:HD domain-containing protein [bacterium]|nr:HD domain-containing protein [bacterium]
MNDDTLTWLFAWFDEYSEPYRRSGNSALAKTSELKVEHTLHVVDEMDRLTSALGLKDDERRLARVIALFHDVGRFEQFKRYNTLLDRVSVDHSVLGVEVLREHNVLRNLPQDRVELIESSILAHNKLHIPGEYLGDRLRFAKMIRDADKLDILRVFIDVDKNNDEEMLQKAYIELNNSDTVNEAIEDHFDRRELVLIEKLRSRHDMRLMMLSWVFDLNFAHSLRRFRDRGDAEYLMFQLPEVPMVRRVRHIVQEVVTDPDRALAERAA